MCGGDGGGSGSVRDKLGSGFFEGDLLLRDLGGGSSCLVAQKQETRGHGTDDQGSKGRWVRKETGRMGCFSSGATRFLPGFSDRDGSALGLVCLGHAWSSSSRHPTMPTLGYQPTTINPPRYQNQ